MAAASSLYPRAEIVRRACARDESGFGPTHANGWYELTWLERGTASYRFGQRQLTLRAGECLLLAPELEHTPWVQGVCVHQTWIAPELIAYAAAGLVRSSSALPLQEPLVAGPERALCALSRGLFLRALEGFTSDDPGQAATLDAITFALVAPEPSSQRDSPRLRAARDLIATCYAQPLQVEDLARAAGMNRFTFMRAFRAACAQSPYQYLVGYRLDRAADALHRAGAGSVLDVALACGFEDPSRFASMFRGRFGCSPSEYRRQARR